MFCGGVQIREGGPNPLADMDRGGPNPIADLDRGVQIRCDTGYTLKNSYSYSCSYLDLKVPIHFQTTSLTEGCVTIDVG